MDTGQGESDPPESQWWQALPPAEVTIRCGEQEHVIRWADGSLTLPAHPDAEAELVLGALGGQSARCIELAEMWGRHGDDLDVLVLGPRSAADRVWIGWHDLSWASPRITPTPGGGLALRPPSPVPPGVTGRGGQWMRQQQRVVTTFIGTTSRPAAGIGFTTHQLVKPDPEGRWVSRIELLQLFALGPALQMRLAGAVAAGLAGQAQAGGRAANRPRLTAALTGRLAPAARDWLGIDPDRVTVTVHEGPGWGSLELIGTGDDRSLRASLPVTWLAQVWACGLAVARGHLVVAVRAARWPDAEVLALPEPGGEPTVLRLRGSLPAGEPEADPRWSPAGSGDQADTP